MSSVRLRGLALLTEPQLSVCLHSKICCHRGVMGWQRVVAIICIRGRSRIREYRYCVGPVEEDVESEAKE